jgi:3-oxoacyl-[acyl-carrier protein] reductase
MQLKGKTVAITGAARGIGRAIAEDFAAQGANLALIDLTESELAESCAACQAHGVTARGYSASVSTETDVVATFERIVADFGRLDGLVNNAGIVRDALLVKVKDGRSPAR